MSLAFLPFIGTVLCYRRGLMVMLKTSSVIFNRAGKRKGVVFRCPNMEECDSEFSQDLEHEGDNAVVYYCVSTGTP